MTDGKSKRSMYWDPNVAGKILLKDETNVTGHL